MFQPSQQAKNRNNKRIIVKNSLKEDQDWDSPQIGQDSNNNKIKTDFSSLKLMQQILRNHKDNKFNKELTLK